MKQIKQIFDILSQEEIVAFITYLKKKNRRGDTKNIQLCTLILAGETETLDVKLYKKPSKNAYHGLCKRVQDSLIDFVATKSFDDETLEELAILKLLLASRILFEHKQYKIACKTLEKAERIAQQFDVYTILSEVYHTKIQYAHVKPSWVLHQIIELSQQNTIAFLQEQQLNMAYATIKNTFQKQPNGNPSKIITKTLQQFDIKISETLTYKSIFQLMNISVTEATSKNNYYDVLPYLKELYALVENKKEIALKHVFYYLEILYVMAFSYFRNKECTISQQYIFKMKQTIQSNKNKYLHLFEDRILLTEALNYTYSGENIKAINLLQAKKNISLSCQLSLMLALFQEEQFKDANGIIKSFYHSDIWYEKKAGWIWVVKKAIIELLILIELDKLDLVLSRLQSFKSKFSKKLNSLEETRVLTFIQLVSYYYENPKSVTTATFAKKVEGSFEWIGREREDIFVMSFYAWLKAKMENRKLYEVTLELVDAR